MPNAAAPGAGDLGFVVSAPCEARAALLLDMRGRGVQDVNVLRALETAPREIFAPHRYQDLARRNLALPLRCGQTLPEPWLTAKMLEALSLSPRCRALEVGTGSGYAATLIARLCDRLVSAERFRTLAVEARARLAQLDVANVDVVWADGLDAGAFGGTFDRIIVQGALPEPPQSLLDALAPEGVLVMARPERGEPRRQHVVRIARNPGGSLDVVPICACRLQPIVAGRSQAL